MDAIPGRSSPGGWGARARTPAAAGGAYALGVKTSVGSCVLLALAVCPALVRADEPAPVAPPIPGASKSAPAAPDAVRPVAGEASRPAYPASPKGDVTYELHGETIADPYRWLEDDEAESVVRWDEAQQALLRARLDALPFRAAWKAKIDAELDLPSPGSLPRFEGGREWWIERAAGANHGVLKAKNDDGTGERAVLDPNGWSANGTEGLKGWHPSPDGRLLAYGRDSKGDENAVIFLRDLATDADLPFRLTRMKFGAFCWAPDSKGFFYSRRPDPESVPEAERAHHSRVYYHPLGGLILDDELVYGTGRPAIEGMFVFRSSDDRHVFLGRGMPYGPNDFFEILTEADGRHRLAPVLVGVPAITHLDRTGDEYVLMTDLDAPRKRIVRATPDEVGDPAKWRMLLPQGDGVIEDFGIAEGRVVVHVRENVFSHLRVLPLDGQPPVEAPLPVEGTVGGLVTRRGDSRVWFALDAYESPFTVYRIDAAQPLRVPQALRTARTTVDLSRLVTERATYKSRDGTRIPIFMLRRKDVPLDGAAPIVLSGYGGFRVGRYPGWSASAALWVEAGGVHAVACLRGGDEFGEEWHQAGSLAKKQNVFDDFIAGADWLVETGRARRDRLAILGGSNGGLLVAACVNQRPDLCRAAVSAVPLTDMLRYHRFQYAKVWTQEYGDPDVKEEFGWIRPYSPVHNAKSGVPYPAVLLTAGLHDGRVNAFHARKMAAIWQAATTSERPILLSIDRDSGHGSASRRQAKAELLDRWTFLLMELTGAK